MVAEFQSKHPHSTCWVEVTYSEGEASFMSDLIVAMSEVGWRAQPEDAPPVYGMHKQRFGSSGSDLFNGWTVREYRLKMDRARRVLKHLNIPWTRRKLTLADCL